MRAKRVMGRASHNAQCASTGTQPSVKASMRLVFFKKMRAKRVMGRASHNAQCASTGTQPSVKAPMRYFTLLLITILQN